MTVVVQVGEHDAARGERGMEVPQVVVAVRVGDEDTDEASLEGGPAHDEVGTAVAIQVADRDAERLGTLDEGELPAGVGRDSEAAALWTPGAACKGDERGERRGDVEDETFHGARKRTDPTDSGGRRRGAAPAGGGRRSSGFPSGWLFY